MAPRFHTLFWLRRATQSLAPPDHGAGGGDGDGDGGLTYRLRRWPPLPGACRTARVFRVLDLMSRQPVSQGWLLDRSGLTPVQVGELILNLVVQRAVDVSDVG